jgi:photosynthetic reaction center cytochrome c subunit
MKTARTNSRAATRACRSAPGSRALVGHAIRQALLIATTGLGLASLASLSGCERPMTQSYQAGYRGLGMVQVKNPSRTAAQAANNRAPAPLPKAPVEAGGPVAGDTFKNVQVLKDLPVPEFTRLMVAVTSWVAPTQGCAYCHNATDLSSDALYTKVVARRMFAMTRHVNTDWHQHVANTGVTCYTCHRGHNVPAQIWFTNPGPANASAFAGNKAGQNAPSAAVRYASLPNDPFTTFLESPREIRVVSEVPLREGGMGPSIKQAEQTYGLMMHFTEALGVNCTYCHNSRSFFDWDQSTPQRAVAWYGIRLVRDLNTQYLDPLASTLPPNRHGPYGDGPKLDCATCHQGAFRPLNGARMLVDYPELGGTK